MVKSEESKVYAKREPLWRILRYELDASKEMSAEKEKWTCPQSGRVYG